MSQSVMDLLQIQEMEQRAIGTLDSANALINRSYLAEMRQYPVLRLEEHQGQAIQRAGDIRLFRIERIVQSNKQSVLESTTAAYTALGAAGHSVFLFLKSDGRETDLYIGTRGEPGKMLGQNAGELLCETFKGHFAGSALHPLNMQGVNTLLDGLQAEKDNPFATITTVTGVPALSTEQREHFMQGLERFIDAAEQRVYQALILAEPVSSQNLDLVRTGYEQVSTQLSPLLKQQLSFSEQESDSVGLSISLGLSESLGHSLGLTESKGTSQTAGISSTETAGTSQTTSTSSTDTTGTSRTTTTSTTKTKGTSRTEGTSVSETAGTSWTKSTSDSKTKGASSSVKAFFGDFGVNSARTLANTLSFGLNKALTVGRSTSIGSNHSTSFGKSESIGTSHSTSHGESESIGTSHSTSLGKSESTGTSHGESVSRTSSTNQATTMTDGRSLNKTTGTNRQVSIEMVNKTIEQLLGKIDHHLQRIDEAKTYGGWHSAAYFIGDSTASSESLASLFLGLIRGSKSSHEDFALTTWTSAHKPAVLDWLTSLSHPQFRPHFSNQVPVPYVTPATLISSKEMAIQMSLPRSSTSTVSVVETQVFGRQVQLLDGPVSQVGKNRKLNLGNIRHLWENLPQTIELSLEQLSSHVFITGSTGSGKSNTVYGILEQLDEQAVSFLVIETAKGEYKHVFGHRDNVRVLGTNKKHTELLRINPFSFPEDTHVLEHADRLIEIFNVCWPMYAAMPAILREAILQSYRHCGWDLDSSINTLADDCFPTVIDLLQQLEIVINSSTYSQEMKSNYSGALLTRVKSLTNGINGQIFTADEHSCEELFDRNIIIDLSRVGSMETKSLITGLLIIKLSEYRTQQGGMNRSLHHVTVLEEAHNILGRSSVSGAEGSSITEKSVEMLANAIAEMRTYGEGFIIADQSPSALHSAAIRNTNTKVIMRLPDDQDRQQAGKSAGLNDEQINELARLPRGVAVVYQNNWQEAVQCKIVHFIGETRNYMPPSVDADGLDSYYSRATLIRWLLAPRMGKAHTHDLNNDQLLRCINRYQMTTLTRIALRSCLVENKSSSLLKPKQFCRQARIVVELLNAEQDLAQCIANSPADFSEFNIMLDNVIKLQIGEVENSLVQAIRHCIMKDLSEKNESYLKLYSGWSAYMRGAI